MNKYIELNNNLENLKLTRIKEILPVTLDSLKNEDKSLVDVLYELTKSEIEFRDERARKINVTISSFPYHKRSEERRVGKECRL